MKRRRKWLPVVLAAGLTTVVYLLWAPPPRPDGDVPVTPPRSDREFAGDVVDEAGAPVEGADVRLFEDAERGFDVQARSDARGRFAVVWRPTATADARRLRLVAVVGRGERRSPIVPADPAGTTLVVRRAVGTSGRILDTEGTPVPGATVALAEVGAQEGFAAVADDEGRFTFPTGFAEGAPLQVIAHGAGCALQRDDRFRAGDPVLLRLPPGRDVRISVRDPDGHALAGARCRPHLPRVLARLAPTFVAGADGAIEVRAVASDAAALFDVEADGHLPLAVVAAPHEATSVVLWPDREVTLVVWDPFFERGLDGVDFEFAIDPLGAADPALLAAWWGENPSRLLREYPVRPGARSGEYRLHLPQCAVTCVVSDPTHADAEVRIEANDSRAVARLRPLRMRGTARLQLEARDAPPRLPILVVAEEAVWVGRVTLQDGRGSIEVPSGLPLQVASAGAVDGSWVPRTDLDGLAAGTRRDLVIPVRRAIRLRVRCDPPVAGEAVFEEAALKGFGHAVTRPLVGGECEFWSRPLRKVKVTVRPKDNYFEHTGEFATEQTDQVWEAYLRPSSGLRLRVRDRAGRPVPFAGVTLFEPTLAGHLDLRYDPREVAADARGVVEVVGLRSGEAAFEVRAPSFRTQRFALLRFERGEWIERDVVLEPAGWVTGRVVDHDGNPVAGVWVRVLASGLRTLETPGGGRLPLYDIVGSQDGSAATDAEGRFDVRDETADGAVLGLFPDARPELANTAALRPPEGGDVVLNGRAHVAIDAPQPIRGVYQILPGGRAVLIAIDPPMSPKPLPVVVPAGRIELFVRLRTGAWASVILELKRGETVQPRLRYQRP